MPLDPDTALAPDAALAPPRSDPSPLEPFGSFLDVAGSALDRADGAERAFASGRGGILEMVVERANADVMLSTASAAAQRASQAIATLVGMQV